MKKSVENKQLVHIPPFKHHMVWMLFDLYICGYYKRRPTLQILLTMFTPQFHIQGLIFDLDGTLADTMPMHIESWIEAGDHHGVLITEKMIHDHAGVPTVQVIEIFNKDFAWNIDPYDFREVKNDIYLELKSNRGIGAINEVVEIAEKWRKPQGNGDSERWLSGRKRRFAKARRYFRKPLRTLCF